MSRLPPTAAVRRAYEAIEVWDDPALFLHVPPLADALRRAEAVEASSDPKPMAGLVFAVKDNIDVAGMPTTAACPAFSHIAERSAFVVARLEAAGAVVIGKVNLDQFATGLVGVRSPFGVPRNALDPTLIPGGSSSGSATAVAAGIVDFSLGTDTAGSGRIPAGMNGIVGLKPSLGLLSATGMVPACRTLDTISVFARSVSLAREVTAAAAGYDCTDAYSRRLPPPAAGSAPPRFRVGVPVADQRRFFGDTSAAAAYAADLVRLAALGGEIVELEFTPLHAIARLLYEGPWVAERYAATKPLIETSPEAFHPTTLKIIGGAKDLTAVSTFEAMYRLADLKRAADPILAQIDLLAVPTVPRVYTLEDLAAEPVLYNSNLGTYTNFVNLLDLAAISVPVGKRDDGLPSSLTLIGAASSDGYLAAIAGALVGEPQTAPIAQPAVVEVAVVGAHLSGLPLNPQLLALGARLVRETTTAPDYRLYALAGTVPPKPGMLRVADGTGGSLAVEVWAMTAEAFGRFVAEIPAPLGIGTVRLADGSAPKGFLVEAEAVTGAADITSYGGWRAYLAR